MIKEHDRIVLKTELPDLGLRKGDLGTVIMVHHNGAGYEVEFMTIDGETIGVETLLASDIRAVRRREIAQARMVGVRG